MLLFIIYQQMMKSISGKLQYQNRNENEELPAEKAANTLSATCSWYVLNIAENTMMPNKMIDKYLLTISQC
jgi:hypothetical protein